MAAPKKQSLVPVEMLPYFTDDKKSKTAAEWKAALAKLPPGWAAELAETLSDIPNRSESSGGPGDREVDYHARKRAFMSVFNRYEDEDMVVTDGVTGERSGHSGRVINVREFLDAASDNKDSQRIPNTATTNNYWGVDSNGGFWAREQGYIPSVVLEPNPKDDESFIISIRFIKMSETEEQWFGQWQEEQTWDKAIRDKKGTATAEKTPDRWVAFWEAARKEVNGEPLTGEQQKLAKHRKWKVFAAAAQEEKSAV